MTVIGVAALSGLVVVVALKVLLAASRVAPALRRDEGSEVVALLGDVWIPAMMAAPLALTAFLNEVPGSDGPCMDGGGAWLALVGGVFAGAVGGAAALIRGESITSVPLRRADLFLPWSVGAVLLLLLALSDRLSVWVGQAFFALVAVTFWQRSSRVDPKERVPDSARRAGAAMVLVLMLTLAEVILTRVCWNEGVCGAAWSATGSALLILLVLAPAAGATWALRAALWVAVMAPALGAGMLALRAMLPSVIAAIHGELSYGASGVMTGLAQWQRELALPMALVLAAGSRAMFGARTGRIAGAALLGLVAFVILRSRVG